MSTNSVNKPHYVITNMTQPQCDHVSIYCG